MGQWEMQTVIYIDFANFGIHGQAVVVSVSL